VEVVVEQKVHLLEMVALAVAHPRQAVEQLLEREFLVKEIMAVQVLVMQPMMPLLVVVVAQAQ
jgi:hypothetical protein